MAKQNDLFGDQPKRHPDNTMVTLALHTHPQSTPKAWFLSKTGRERDAKWIPKALCTLDDTRAETFTLTRQEALKRGWL